MQIILRLSLVVFISAVLFSGCDSSLDGNLNENMPPSTYLTIDNIEVDEENRLSSRVDISWWGDDPDGYIVGYEYVIGDTTEGNWNFTTRTDSTFILPISPGQEVDDVLFVVRAIDNQETADPEGASVVFPLKNTDPVTELNPLEMPPDTTFGLFSFGWTISDPDGQQTILRTEIAVNDTTNGWTEIPIESDDQEGFFISLMINNQSQSTASADLFLGRSFRNSGITVDGLIPESENTFYVRTTDRALAESKTEEFTWYIKRQESNILLLNDNASSSSQSALQFHIENLGSIGFEADVIDISDGSGLQGGTVPLSTAFPRVIDPTLNRMLAQWDYIYFISNSLNRNINYAQEILDLFFDESGKLFATIPVTRNVSRLEDPLYNFLPMSGFVPLNSSDGENGFQIRKDFPVTPINGGPRLAFTEGRDRNLWPFEALGSATPLYEGQFLIELITGGSAEYDGPGTIAVLNPEENFLYFGMDLTTIGVVEEEQSDEDNIVYEDDISELLEELLINRLGFTQQ